MTAFLFLILFYSKVREYSGQKNETSKKISMQEPEQNQVENQDKDQLKVPNPLFRTVEGHFNPELFNPGPGLFNGIIHQKISHPFVIADSLCIS